MSETPPHETGPALMINSLSCNASRCISVYTVMSKLPVLSPTEKESYQAHLQIILSNVKIASSNGK